MSLRNARCNDKQARQFLRKDLRVEDTVNRRIQTIQTRKENGLFVSFVSIINTTS